MSGTNTVLVTGGAGYVGSHFARAAAEEGSRVVVLDEAPGPALFLSKAIERVRGDIADRELVARLLREHHVTACVHFAGKIQVAESVQYPALYYDYNVVRTLALLETIVSFGPIPFVFSSSAAVYGVPDKIPVLESSDRKPISPYGCTKLVIEEALQAFGNAYALPWAALRYFNAAGAHPDGTMSETHEPETHLIPLVIDAALGRRAALLVYGADYTTRDGTCVRDYVHVQDLAAAHLAALRVLWSGTQIGTLNLGSGIGCSVREVLDETARIVGRAVPFSWGPRRAGDPPVLLASNERALSVLRWRTKRSDLSTIIEDALRSRR